MIIIIKENYEQLSKQAFQIIESKIKSNKRMVMGLATGSTPLGSIKTL